VCVCVCLCPCVYICVSVCVSVSVWVCGVLRPGKVGGGRGGGGKAFVWATCGTEHVCGKGKEQMSSGDITELISLMDKGWQL
jgi:hypothetical protein